MKRAKYILSILLFTVGFVASVQAGDSIVNRNVTVEREYKPVIQAAGKINSVPKVLEPSVEKAAATYSDFNLPLNAGFNIHTLPAADLEREKRPDNKGGFARIGLGNPLNTLADFAYPIINTSDLKLDFSLNHLGTFGTKAHSTTKAALSVDKNFKTFDLYGGLGGGHEYLKYYGRNYNNYEQTVNLDTLAKYNPLDTYHEQNFVAINRPAKDFSLTQLANDSSSNTFWRFNAFAGVRSQPLSDGLRYQGEMMYRVFNSRNGLTEHLLHTQAGFNTVYKQDRAGVDIEMYNLNYRSDNAVTFNFVNAYTVLGLNPYYSIHRTAFDVRLGVKSSFSLAQGNLLNPSADISAEWRAIPQYLSVYGGITGGYKVNTLDEMATENRYLYADVRVKDTYSPYEFYAGLKLRPLYNLLLDAYIDYRGISNQYFFVNKEYSLNPPTVSPLTPNATLFTNRFNVIYSAATQFKVGARANYNYKNLVNVELKGAYNGWDVATQQYAWNKPQWEASLNADVHINREWSVSANAFYEGGRYAMLGSLQPLKMNDKIDINLGTSYVYNSWLTAFAKVNNLINNRYQNFYGYDVQGFNMLVGAAFSF